MNNTTQFNRMILAGLFLLAGTSAFAQITCSRTSVPGNFDIRSTADYKTAQDSIQVIAYAIHNVYKAYPEFTYVHHVDDQGNIAAVSVMGIRDTDKAVEAAHQLMAMEVIGESIRTMNPSLVPPPDIATSEKKMTRRQTVAYQPAPRLPKGKSQEKAPSTTSNAAL